MAAVGNSNHWVTPSDSLILFYLANKSRVTNNTGKNIVPSDIPTIIAWILSLLIFT